MKAVRAYRYGLFFLIVLAGFAADLSTKRCTFDRLGFPPQPPCWIWRDRVGLETSVNEGALFGMGQGGVRVFVALSILAAIGILVWLFRGGAAGDLLLTVTLACIFGGIVGNLYDRLGLHGLTWPPGYPPHPPGSSVYAVRDWILVMILDNHFPNFNIADSMLVCGAILLVWHAWRGEEGKEKGETRSAHAAKASDRAR
jgi:signal peptidase II